ncbi:hypothetical protein CLU79DRAFT_754018 [Phycomyces nitens]|nr:hypothetical protein CLU79DRAFT_754018 [Phycomyces nitens]
MPLFPFLILCVSCVVENRIQRTWAKKMSSEKKPGVPLLVEEEEMFAQGECFYHYHSETCLESLKECVLYRLPLQIVNVLMLKRQQ